LTRRAQRATRETEEKIMKRCFINALCLLGLIAGTHVETDAVQAQPDSNAAEFACEETAQDASVANEFRQTFENAVPTFGLTLTVKGADGRTDGRFVVGDEGAFILRSESDGYVYLFNEYTDKNGVLQVKKLFPNRNEDNFIAANAEVVFPRPEDDFTFVVTEANGRERLMALVVDQKYPPFEKMKFTDEESIKEASKTLTKCFAAVYSEDTDNAEDAEDAEFPEVPEVPEVPESPLNFGRRTLRVDTFASKEERDAIKKKTFFVGVGVNKFKFNGERILNLPACVNDVLDMKDLLLEQGVVAEEDCLVLLNEEATRENVRQLFQVKLPELAASGGSIIVCFSTHGMSAASVEKERARGREIYLVLHDSDPKNLRETAISSNEFGDWAQQLQNSRILFLFDNCYSGLMIDERYEWDEFINPVTKAKSLGQPNICIIASSSSDQESGLEFKKNLLYRSRSHSLMTNNILKALEENRSLSAKELYEKVKPVVETRYAEIYGENRSSAQFMNFASSFGDDVFIVNPTSEDELD
jgi:hypothetical protein